MYPACSVIRAHGRLLMVTCRWDGRTGEPSLSPSSMEPEPLIACLVSEASSAYMDIATQSGSLSYSSLQRVMRSIQSASNRHSLFQKLAQALWGSQSLCQLPLSKVCNAPQPHAQFMCVTCSPPFMPLCAVHHMIATLSLRYDCNLQRPADRSFIMSILLPCLKLYHRDTHSSCC